MCLRRRRRLAVSGKEIEIGKKWKAAAAALKDEAGRKRESCVN